MFTTQPDMHLLLALHLEWFSRMASGQKTVELRRTHPADPATGTLFFSIRGTCYGQATVCSITQDAAINLAINHHQEAAMTPHQAMDYLQGAKDPIAYHICEVVRYKAPLPIVRTPQSWQFMPPSLLHAAQQAHTETLQYLQDSYKALTSRYIEPHLLGCTIAQAYPFSTHLMLHNTSRLAKFTTLLQDRKSIHRYHPLDAHIIADTIAAIINPA